MLFVVKVYLKVCSEDEQNDAAPNNLESSSVWVDEFGLYVDDLHKNNNRGFKEQFYVSVLGHAM